MTDHKARNAQILDALKDESAQAVADRFGLSRSYVYRLRSDMRRNGHGETFQANARPTGPTFREIGQGPRAGRDLTRDEAREAMSLILSQQATPAQAGAFLLVQRYKGESPDELTGFAEAVRAGARTIAPNVEGLLDIGSPYDGRKKSIVVSPASALVVAAAGVPVVMHGEKRIGPKFGVPIGDVLEALGIDIDGEPEAVERSIEETGVGFMRQSRFVPQVFALRELRTEIALRTCLSTVEKIYNLAGASYSLLGLSHLPYAKKMLAAASQMGFRRVMIVQGVEGNEDAPTSRPCRAFLWDSTIRGDSDSPLPRTGEGPGVRANALLRIRSQAHPGRAAHPAAQRRHRLADRPRA